MSTRTYGLDGPSQGSGGAPPDAYSDLRGAGWLTFATVMLGVVGTWNVVEGLLAIGQSHIYGRSSTYIFSDLRTWGWIVLALGVLQLVAACTLVSGSEIARWFGVAVAAVNGIGQLAWATAYPVWALSMFAVDVMIIYALVAYAGHKLRT